MKVSRVGLAGIVAERALKGKATKRFVESLAAYLLREGKLAELPSLLRDVQSTWAREGYVAASAVSARPLTAPVRHGLIKEIHRLHPDAKRVTLSERIDPRLIGGVTLMTPEYRLDLSVRGRFKRFGVHTIEENS